MSLQIPVARSSSDRQEAGMHRDRSLSIVWVSSVAPPVRSGWVSPATHRPVVPGLAVVTSPTSGRRRVAVAGAVNLLTAPLLDSALAAAAGPGPDPAGLLLDLARVTFLDVAGLAALRRAERLVARRGWDLVVAPPVAPGPGRLIGAAVRLGWLGSGFGRPT